jgi:hypothetical protein
MCCDYRYRKGCEEHLKQRLMTLLLPPRSFSLWEGAYVYRSFLLVDSGRDVRWSLLPHLTLIR